MSYTFKTTKDSGETLDYAIDFTTILNATEPRDVLSNVEWTVEGRDALLMVVNSDLTSTVAWVLVTGGGINGSIYRLRCRAQTVGGKTIERSILITIQDK